MNLTNRELNRLIQEYPIRIDKQGTQQTVLGTSDMN
jgi:hypothetical protein